MVIVNPLDVFLWTIRRNDKDVIALYRTLSPIMQLATGGSMLNFGLWSSQHNQPALAQDNLCSFFGDFSDLNNANKVIDVGSGLSAPALFWKNQYPHLCLYCININFVQMTHAKTNNDMILINSTSTRLPFTDNSVDRVLALESAQHFKPLREFLFESKRILKDTGLLTLAMPITTRNASIIDLGILKFTWSSEQYSSEYVQDSVVSAGFTISKKQLIGSQVYEPLADYYIQNRETLKKLIQKEFPTYVEPILYKSILKMKDASKKNIIDYVLLKCTK